MFDIQVLSLIDSPAKNNNLFKQIDTDSDNRLSEEEMRAHYLRQSQRMEGEGMTMMDNVKEEQKGHIQKQIKAEDFNGDGFISYEEFGGPKVDQEFPLQKDNYIVISRDDAATAAAAADGPRDEL